MSIITRHHHRTTILSFPACPPSSFLHLLVHSFWSLKDLSECSLMVSAFDALLSSDGNGINWPKEPQSFEHLFSTLEKELTSGSADSSANIREDS
ncbi:MAG: hypothetical protein WB586_17920 [Chthoniobacterales bacterium]